MSKLNFIVDEDFRKILEQDFLELEICLKNNANKSVLILAGSIIEAILVEYLLSLEIKELPKEVLLKYDLNDAITKAFQLGIISQKSKNLSDVVRNYRNLIHPGKAIRLNEIPSSGDASIAKSLVEIIIKEVDQKKQEPYGYTADQILSKIENDSTSEVIWHHLIKKLNDYEKEKLLIESINERYFAILDEYADDEPMPVVLRNLSRFFKTVYSFSPDKIKKKVANKFVKTIREGVEIEVLHSIDYFFISDYLSFTVEEDSQMIKQLLLSHLEKRITDGFTLSLDGISKYFSDEELTKFTNILIRNILNNDDETIVSYAKSFLNNEYLILSEEKQLLIQSELDKKKEYADEERVKKIDELKEYIKDDLPF